MERKQSHPLQFRGRVANSRAVARLYKCTCCRAARAARQKICTYVVKRRTEKFLFDPGGYFRYDSV